MPVTLVDKGAWNIVTLNESLESCKVFRPWLVQRSETAVIDLALIYGGTVRLLTYMMVSGASLMTAISWA